MKRYIPYILLLVFLLLAVPVVSAMNLRPVHPPACDQVNLTSKNVILKLVCQDAGNDIENAEVFATTGFFNYDVKVDNSTAIIIVYRPPENTRVGLVWQVVDQQGSAIRGHFNWP